MVADAAADLYDACCLFTSDIDFLPAVKAGRHMGKHVWVYGYKDVLKDGDRSPYLHVPDLFVDLNVRSIQAYSRVPDDLEKLKAHLAKLDSLSKKRKR